MFVQSKKNVIGAMTLFFSSQVFAVAYPSHNIKKIVSMDAYSAIKIDYASLDKVMADLSIHADSQPVKFDNKKDQKLATTEVAQLTQLLNILKYGDGDIRLMRRSAYILQMANNLGIEGADKEADRLYMVLIKQFPQQADLNLQYGTFLASIDQVKKAQFYVERAIGMGLKDAEYTLAMLLLSQDKPTEALKHFKIFAKTHPNKQLTAQIEDLEKAIKAKK